MLVLAQYGLRHGVDIEINWPGRISVFPIMGGIFFALLVAGWVATALLIWRPGDGDHRHRPLRPRRPARVAAPGCKLRTNRAEPSTCELNLLGRSDLY